MKMKNIFGFFIRLFAAFLVSKLILATMGAETPVRLLGSAVALVLGSYLWDLFGAKLGWVIARLLIGMNQLPPPSKKDEPVD